MKSKKVLGILISMIMVMTTMIIPTTAFGAEGDESTEPASTTEESTEPTGTTDPTDATDPTGATDPTEPTAGQKQDQEITISDEVDTPIVIEYGSGFDLEELKAEAKTDIAYESSDEEVFTVDEENMYIDAVDMGEATLTITAEENDEYNEATKEIEVKVIEAVQTISVDSDIDRELYLNDDELAVEPGESRALNAKAMGEGGRLDYEANPADGSITVDENGVIQVADTALVGDEATININSSGFYGYNDCTFSFVVKVIKYDGYSTDEFFEGPEGYTFYEKESTLYRTRDSIEDEWGDIVIELDPDYDISANAAAGLLNIWNGWKFVKAEKNIVFGEDVEKALADSNTLEMAIGETKALEAVPAETEYSVVGNTDGEEKIVDVDSNGIITPINPGDAVVKATSDGGQWFKDAERTFNVKVNKGTQKISASESIEKNLGTEPFSIDAELSSGDGTLSYESSDPEVAAIDEEGTVTVGKLGTATITINASETDKYEPATKTVEITVVRGKQVITVDSAIKKSIGEKPFEIGAVLAGDGTMKYALNKDGKKVVSVDKNGKVTIKKTGTATVTINAAETDNYLAAEPVKVKITVGKLAKAKLSAVAIGSKKVELTWDEVAGASKYQISQNNSKKTLKGNDNGDGTRTITNTKLKKGKTYKYKIRAVTKVKGKTYYGAWSPVKKVKVK